jgi:GTP-binding protein Era
VAALEALAALGKPITLVLTKVDRLRPPDLLLPVIARWSAAARVRGGAAGQRAHRRGARRAAPAHRRGLPLGEPKFAEDQLSDRSMRWHAGERVRAALFRHLGDELPYACAVTIEAFKEQKRPAKDIIRATIHVERESQKAMVIGKGGQTIKAISIDARKAISRLTGRACDLFLNVTVTANWTRDPALMQRLGSPRGRRR